VTLLSDLLPGASSTWLGSGDLPPFLLIVIVVTIIDDLQVLDEPPSRLMPWIAASIRAPSRPA
jgi:uncharacterized protein (DUF983 family)